MEWSLLVNIGKLLESVISGLFSEEKETEYEIYLLITQDNAMITLSANLVLVRQWSRLVMTSWYFIYYCKASYVIALLLAISIYWVHKGPVRPPDVTKILY